MEQRPETVLDVLGAVSGERYATRPRPLFCPTCKNRSLFALEYPDTRSLFFANMSVLSCDRCGLSFVPTRAKGLRYYYRHLYSLERGRPADVDPALLFSGRYDRKLAIERSKDHLSVLSTFTPRLDALLDVGAGFGATLHLSGAARKVAIEVDASMGAYLAHVGAEIHRDFDKIAPGSMDAVVCSHYLEHLSIFDAVHALKRMMEAVRPGGVCLVEVPHAPLLFLDLDGARHAPHLVFFSADALRRLVERAGGRVRALEPRGTERAVRADALYRPEGVDRLTTSCVLCVFDKA